MNRRSYKNRKKSAPAWVRTGLFILGVFFLFVAGVTLFRTGADPREEKVIQTSDDIVATLTETSDLTSNPARETSRGIPEDVVLLSVTGNGAHAVAKRVVENGVFTHTVLANGLPGINQEEYQYQAWLVRPYPFDFFQTSTLVYNADGSWGMIWVGDAGKTYDEFVDVLITREPVNDFDEYPSSEQVMKGSF